MPEDTNSNAVAADTAPASPPGDSFATGSGLDPEFSFVERRADVVSYMLGETIPGYAEDKLLWSVAADLVDHLATFNETFYKVGKDDRSPDEGCLFEVEAGADLMRFILTHLDHDKLRLFHSTPCGSILSTATADLLGRLVKFRNAIDQGLYSEKLDCWEDLPPHHRLFPRSDRPEIPISETRSMAADALHQADLLFHDLRRVYAQQHGIDRGRDKEIERMLDRADVVRFMFYADDMRGANTAGRIPDAEILKTATEDLLIHIARFRERLEAPDIVIDGKRRYENARIRRWSIGRPDGPTTVDERDLFKLARMREELVTRIELTDEQREHLADIEDALAATPARTMPEIREKAHVAA